MIPLNIYLQLINERFRLHSTDYLIHELIPNELLLAHQFVAHQMQAANDYENMALFNALKITDSKSNQSIYKSMDDRTKYGKEV